MRSRVALIILFGFILFSVITAVTFGWYGYRIYSELSPGSWRAPTEILDRNGRTIVALYGIEWRVAEPVTLTELPDYVPNAFLAAEDTRFRSHFGVDPIGIGRAAAANIAAGGVTEGGSTIMQQLAKMRFLSPERTLHRKFKDPDMTGVTEADTVIDTEDIDSVQANRQIDEAAPQQEEARRREQATRPVVPQPAPPLVVPSAPPPPAPPPPTDTIDSLSRSVSRLHA